MPTAVRRAEAAWRQDHLGVVELGKKLSRKILEDPGPGLPSHAPSSGEAASIARETTAEVLLAGTGELVDRQDKLDEAFGKLVGAVSEAGGGPWEGRLDLTEEALTDWMCEQDDGVEELMERIARKQSELVRLAEVEEEDETPPRSRVTATAAATPQEAGIPGAGQLEAPWYQGERDSHQKARPVEQVGGELKGAERQLLGPAMDRGEEKVSGGQELMAMTRLEVGEQTTEIRKSINELRSFQGCCQDAIRRDEATIRGPRILGSQEDLELKGDEATKKVYALSATLAKKEEKRAGVEERFREYVKRANSGGRALDPKQNPRGAPEVSLLKAQLRYRKQALIDIRRSAHCHQEEAERERDRLAQELLEVRARCEIRVNDLKNALLQKEKNDASWAELLEDLGSKSQKLELKNQELTTICSQLAVRGEGTPAAAAATVAPPVDFCAGGWAVEMEQDKAPRGEWAAGDVAKTQEQAALQQEQDQVVGQLEVRLGEPEDQATPLGRAEGRTSPSRDKRSPNIQDSAAGGPMQLLGVDETGLLEEGCQDGWKTKVWRGLAGFLMLGSYLLGTAAEFFSQEQAPPPDPGPSSIQLRQGRAGLTGECCQGAWRTKVGRSLRAKAETQEQVALQQEQDQGEGQLDRSLSIQDSAARDSRKLLSGDKAERGEESCQDDWKTKVWRSFTRVLLRGGYILGTAMELFPPKKAPLPDPGTSSCQLRQGGAEQIGECGQGAWRSKAWRILARFFRLGSYP